MEFIIKLFACLLFTIALPFSVTQAQESSSKTPLQRGTNTLQFQISNNFNLDSFSGTVFSYKRQLTDVRAKRIGLSLNNHYNWKNYPDSNNNQKDSNLNLNIGINYTWLNYMNPKSDIKFYYGYGPGINLGLEKTVQKQPGQKTTHQQTSYGLAGIGYAGVEWFFQSSMSLHAEYQSSLQINHGRQKTTQNLNGNKQINKTNNTSISLGGNRVRFGLSVYF